MRAERGRLICLEGGDATGKSTLATLLVEELRRCGEPACHVSKNQPSAADRDLCRHLEQLGEALWRYPPGAAIEAWGDEHWLHLLVSWFSVLDRACVQPALAAGQSVVVDGWTYKFRARFSLKTQLSAAHVERCFAHVSRPEQVVLLELEPEAAAERRSDFKRSECGHLDGHAESDPRSAFVAYQRRVGQRLLELLDAPCVRVNVARRSSDELARSIGRTLARSSGALGLDH